MANGNSRITTEVLDLLIPLVANEIGTGCLKGINWALINNRRKTEQNEYAEVWNKLRKMGFAPNEVMRIFKAPNGMIFDLDAVVLKEMVKYLTKGTPEEKSVYAKIEIAYEQRRTAEMFRLADLVEKRMKRGENGILLALFSTSPNLEIRFRGEDENGVTHQYRLPAFALRHCDLQECNLDYIIPRGYIIKKMDIYEILPAENGISYKIYCERNN